jgi:hypothetical protein
MDTLFLTVTGLSLLIALVLAFIVVRLLRDERRRSEARVAALVAMSAGEPATTPAREPVGSHAAAPVFARAAAAPDRASAHHDEPIGKSPPTPARQSGSAERGELELRRSDAEDVAPMFAQPVRSGAWGRRAAIIVPFAVIVAGAGFAFYPTQPDIGAPSTTVATAPPRRSAAPPLELVSLNHSQAGDKLTVTGLVQNPRTAAPVSKVFATAFVFAADGTFLASARAPLDFTTIGPGDESPFVVTVPVKGEIARYRIGFRGEDGRVVAHVDRRAGSPIARASEERR